MSNFRRAVREMLADELRCPKCNGGNLPAPAKPTIEVDSFGRATCDTCGHVWQAPLKDSAK